MMRLHPRNDRPRFLSSTPFILPLPSINAVLGSSGRLASAGATEGGQAEKGTPGRARSKFARELCCRLPFG